MGVGGELTQPAVQLHNKTDTEQNIWQIQFVFEWINAQAINLSYVATARLFRLLFSRVELAHWWSSNGKKFDLFAWIQRMDLIFLQPTLNMLNA